MCVCVCCSRLIAPAEHEKIEGGEDEGLDDEDVTEEVETLRMPRNPILPSAAEIEEHRKHTHTFPLLVH